MLTAGVRIRTTRPSALEGPFYHRLFSHEGTRVNSNSEYWGNCRKNERQCILDAGMVSLGRVECLFVTYRQRIRPQDNSVQGRQCVRVYEFVGTKVGCENKSELWRRQQPCVKVGWLTVFPGETLEGSQERREAGSGVWTENYRAAPSTRDFD